ncbi:MAG TPA: hotdog fold thioesterase [Bacteroidia bacterium]|jgi:1,4-dihydroxy-2-naphthoyl-CoA hydrolase|nr:hotdog fold thioesterase [Bacteroidia bacterium]
METNKIWYAQPTLEQLNWVKANTLAESLDINLIEIGNDYLIGTMPVNNRTKQPFGLLHGGSSVALAETLGSIASLLVVNQDLFIGVGIEINANHVKAATKGLVTGVCKPLHIKGKTHVWETKIYDEAKDMICVSRFTCAIVNRQKMEERKKGL